MISTVYYKARQGANRIQSKPAELSVPARKNDCLAVRAEIGGHAAGYVANRDLLLVYVPNYVPTICVASRKITPVRTKTIWAKGPKPR